MNNLKSMLLHDGLTDDEKEERADVLGLDWQVGSRAQIEVSVDSSQLLVIRHLPESANGDDLRALEACLSVSRRDDQGAVLTSAPPSSESSSGRRRTRYMSEGVLVADVSLSSRQWTDALERWKNGGTFLP